MYIETHLIEILFISIVIFIFTYNLLDFDGWKKFSHFYTTLHCPSLPSILYGKKKYKNIHIIKYTPYYY